MPTDIAPLDVTFIATFVVLTLLDPLVVVTPFVVVAFKAPFATFMTPFVLVIFMVPFVVVALFALTTVTPFGVLTVIVCGIFFT